MARSKQSSRKDNNHGDLTSIAKKLGFQVIDTFHVGDDFPDAIFTTELGVSLIGAFNPVEIWQRIADVDGIEVMHPGVVFLCEIKNPHSSHGLTEGQKKFFEQHQMTKLLVSPGDVYALRRIDDRQNIGGTATNPTDAA